jgi:hypothetical protein
MNFDPYNCLLKVQKFSRTSTPKVGAHLGVCGFIPLHSPTFLGAWNVIPMLHSWLAPLQALALVMNPRLGSWQSNSYKRKLKKMGIRHPRRGSIQPFYLSFSFFGFVRPYNKQDLAQEAFLEYLCYTLLRVIIHYQLLKMHLISQITLY